MRRGVALIVAMLALPGPAPAKGGLHPKSPRRFTQQELILIEHCNRLAATPRVEAEEFARQCLPVRPYIRP
jgi:hypothetical protein